MPFLEPQECHYRYGVEFKLIGRPCGPNIRAEGGEAPGLQGGPNIVELLHGTLRRHSSCRVVGLDYESLDVGAPRYGVVAGDTPATYYNGDGARPGGRWRLYNYPGWGDATIVFLQVLWQEEWFNVLSFDRITGRLRKRSLPPGIPYVVVNPNGYIVERSPY